MDKQNTGLFSTGSNATTSRPELKTIGMAVGAIVVILGLVIVLIMSRGSSSVSTANGSNGAIDPANGPTSTDTFKNTQSAGCIALTAFLFADLSGKQGAAGSTSPAQQEQTITQLTKAAKSLRPLAPQFAASIDARLAYVTKLVHGAPDVDADRAAADKALVELNTLKLNMCVPVQFPGANATP